jgi:hypothetical protein
MDNNYRPPGGDPGDHQPTEQFWPGQGTPAGSQDPGQQPGRQAHMAKDRRKALRWTVGIALAAVLAGGGVIAGVSLASPTLSTTPTASTGTASAGSAAAPAGQAALLNTALNAAADPNAAAATTAGAASSGPASSGPASSGSAGSGSAGSGAAASPAGAGPAAGPCARAVRDARLARLEGRPLAARRAAAVAVIRCRFIRHRIIRFFLLRGIDGQFTFRGRTGTIRTLAYERGVIESVSSSSIVVKGDDGTTSTWDLVSNTVVREPGHVVSESALGDGEQVWVGGPVANGTKDARLIFVNPPGGSS